MTSRNHEDVVRKFEKPLSETDSTLWSVLGSSGQQFWLNAAGPKTVGRERCLRKLKEGGLPYFRFYDPRVLRTFLPTCDVAQVMEFFGPVRIFICEDEDPGSLLVFSHYKGQLKVDRFPNTLIPAS